MTVATLLSPLDVVRRFMALMEPLDYDAALKLMSGSVEYINPPPIGAVRGPEGVRAVLEPFFAPTLENQLKILRAAAAGPVVFVERLDRHRLARQVGRAAGGRRLRGPRRPHHLLARLFRCGDDPVAMALGLT